MLFCFTSEFNCGVGHLVFHVGLDTWCCFVLHLSLTVGLDTWCCFVLHLSLTLVFYI